MRKSPLYAFGASGGSEPFALSCKQGTPGRTPRGGGACAACVAGKQLAIAGALSCAVCHSHEGLGARTLVALGFHSSSAVGSDEGASSLEGDPCAHVRVPTLSHALPRVRETVVNANTAAMCAPHGGYVCAGPRKGRLKPGTIEAFL